MHSSYVDYLKQCYDRNLVCIVHTRCGVCLRGGGSVRYKDRHVRLHTHVRPSASDGKVGLHVKSAFKRRKKKFELHKRAAVFNILLNTNLKLTQAV